MNKSEFHATILNLSAGFSTEQVEEFLKQAEGLTEDEEKDIDGKGLTIGNLVLWRRKKTFIWQERYEGLRLGGICLVRKKAEIKLPPRFFLSYVEKEFLPKKDGRGFFRETQYVWSRFCKMRHITNSTTFLKGFYQAEQTWENGIILEEQSCSSSFMNFLEIVLGAVTSLIFAVLLWTLIYS